MGFLIAYFVVAVSCIVISGRTLIAYTDFSIWIKTCVYLLFLYAWFSPILMWNIQAKLNMPVGLYTCLAKFSYFLFGFAFLLTMVLLFRDIIWALVYYLGGKHIVSPTDNTALGCANLITLCLTLLMSFYAVYAAEKLPDIKHYRYADTRIQKDVKIVMASDLHITKMTSVDKVKEQVDYINQLQPDIILLPGDIADDKVEDIKAQIKELKKLKAPLGIYYTTGNHETYFDAFAWEAEFAALGWTVLHNSGVSVPNTGIYIGGVPDIHGFSTNMKQTVRNAADNEYRIVLSHIPTTAKYIGNTKIDILVAGHTHGGQIFPFNILTKYGNDGYVFGEYKLNNTVILVSRGVGYWGPPMRLGAPNDLMVIELYHSEKS